MRGRASRVYFGVARDLVGRGVVALDRVVVPLVDEGGIGGVEELHGERERGVGDESEKFNDDLMAELMADFQNGSADDGAHNAYDDASSENILKYANAKADL